MAADHSSRRNSNTELLEELESLSQSLYHSHPSNTTNRRTASLALPRTSVPSLPFSDASKAEEKPNDRPRSRRLSLSPWRSTPKLGDQNADDSSRNDTLLQASDEKKKKGIWKWKPIRALSHLGRQKISCLFSVEVVTVQGLPASMNGLRLSVGVRKKETKDGAVHTMPSRVSQGAADFEETLFLRCHIYSASAHGKQLKLEPRLFWIYVFAVDAQELDLGRSCVNLSQLVQESVEKNYQGTRLRLWETSFSLSGKAKGGELVLKLGFQIMEKDGGVGIYGQPQPPNSDKSKIFSSSSFARKHSKSSFSIPSPKMQAWTPSHTAPSPDLQLQGMDDLNLDDPSPSAASIQNSKQPQTKIDDDDDMPDFEVVDRGVEVQDKEEAAEQESHSTLGGRSVSSEVVKEILLDPVHLKRLSELDSIAQQIKLLESMMADEKTDKTQDDTDSQILDADEETITREFLLMLEDRHKLHQPQLPSLPFQVTKPIEQKAQPQAYLPDLAKGLGSVIQTRNGGFLAAMNPLDTPVEKEDIPKLAMQISKPLLLSSHKSTNGFEVFQWMAGTGLQTLSSQLFSLMPMDDLGGKTAEQIAFEGIASAIIQGRNKEGASSSAARTIAAVKTMATAMNTGRKERISTGLWNLNEEPVTVEEILALSLQKIEKTAIDALKIQADIADEEAPFDVSPLDGKDHDHLLTSAVSLDDWMKNHSSVNSPEDPETIMLSLIVQLRDPIRQYEAVGGPVIALIQATQAETKPAKYVEEMRFKVTGLHVGGFKVRTAEKLNVWDTEKQRLTAIHWLVAYGLGKSGKKGKLPLSKGQDLLWSISSRVMADMWLKAIRNPDIKLAVAAK